MRIIAQARLTAFCWTYPSAKPSLQGWVARIRAGHWRTAAEIQAAFPKAKVLNGERVRFEISGGDYRLIVAFKFTSQIAFIKFIGTHADYDRVDALTVSRY